MTEKQYSILVFVQNYHATHRFWPDIDLIRAELGVGKTLQAMQNTIRKLETRGYVVRKHATRRGRVRMTVEISPAGVLAVATSAGSVTS